MLYRSARFSAYLIAAVTAASAANASPVYSHVTASQEIPFSDIFTLSTFDTSLGTLAAVDISLSFTDNANILITDNRLISEPFSNANASVPITLNANVGPLFFTESTTAIAGPLGGIAAPGDNTFSGSSSAGSYDFSISAADFSFFETPAPTFTISYTFPDNDGTYGGTSVSHVFFGGSADWGGTTTVNYTYSVGGPGQPVPEPITLSLFGAGLAGAAVLRRRKRKAT